MPELIPPPWGTDWKPPPPKPPKEPGVPGNPSWKAGGPSPNPSGRTPGIPDKRLLATEQLLQDMRAIISVLCAKALEGDTGAISLVLSRVMPAVKAQAQKVEFDLNTDAPISGQIAQVLDAVATGQLAPDVGRLICESIGVLANARAIELLEARASTLEESEP